MNDVILVEIIDNVYFRIYCGEDQSMELSQYFTCFATNYQNHPRFRARMWNGKISFFDRYEHTLPIGLLRHLKPFLRQYGYKVKFLFDMEELKNPLTRSELEEFYDALYEGVTNKKGEPIRPRDYQEDAIFNALRHKRGVLESATGSGKSLIIYSIIQFIIDELDGKILLVVPDVGLVNQMYNDFKSYGWGNIYKEVSLLFSKSKMYDKNKKVLISTWQSVYKRGERFFKDFEAVLIDETHGAKSASIQSMLKKCVNAHYRLGFTGTLPDEPADKFNIFGYIGPKIYTLKSKTLIDRGYLSKITIVNMFLKYTRQEAIDNVGRSYKEEVKSIIENPERNKVFKYIVGHIKPTDNVLILCERRAHLASIKEYMAEHFPEREIFIIQGGVKGEKREAIRHEIEESSGALLIATYGTVSTGINIPKLHHVIFASFYKSKIKVLQSIGRGLRLHESKKRVIIWDIIDDMKAKKKNGRWLNNYAIVHFLKRLTYYKDQGFDFIDRHKKLKEL